MHTDPLSPLHHPVPAPHVRSSDDGDSVVLLDPARGKYYTFNGVAARVWRGLQRGAGRRELLHTLARTFPDAGGRLEPDLDRLLERLLQLGLVTVDGAAPPPATTHRYAPAAPALRRPPSTLAAWAALVLVDLLLAAGYRRFQRFVASRPVHAAGAAPGDGATAGAVRRAVDRAARLYFKRAWCLQRSAVTVWLLRRRGVAAELVVGVRRVPFLAHAWVEVDGAVVNDRPTVSRFYDPVHRL